MLIGANVSMKAPKMLTGAAEEAASYGATTLQFYTGAPQNTKRKAVSEMNIEAGLAVLEANHITHPVIHAPYIINLGNTVKPENFPFAVEFMQQEVARADALHGYTMPFHPGAHVGAGAEVAIAQIAKGLDQIITPNQQVTIALETMAGKGTEIGRRFEELAAIIDRTANNDRLRVTMDTCHMNDAGYPVATDFDSVLNQFDHIVGLERLSVIHVNDSKNPQGSHKDRHANIGFGTIGFEALNAIVHHPQLTAIPKILETPYVGVDKKTAQPPYATEIKWLTDQRFNPAELAVE